MRVVRWRLLLALSARRSAGGFCLLCPKAGGWELGAGSWFPLQDFSKPWTDAELYAKYGLSEGGGRLYRKRDKDDVGI